MLFDHEDIAPKDRPIADDLATDGRWKAKGMVARFTDKDHLDRYMEAEGITRDGLVSHLRREGYAGFLPPETHPMARPTHNLHPRQFGT